MWGGKVDALPVGNGIEEPRGDFCESGQALGGEGFCRREIDYRTEPRECMGCGEGNQGGHQGIRRSNSWL